MGEMHCVNGVCEMSSRKSSQMEALDAYIKSLPLADNPTRKRGFLIQTLHKAQSLFGYLPVEVQSFVAERLGISLAEVYGVISFYSFFTDKPIGRYAINVCTGTACFSLFESTASTVSGSSIFPFRSNASTVSAIASGTGSISLP